MSIVHNDGGELHLLDKQEIASLILWRGTNLQVQENQRGAGTGHDYCPYFRYTYRPAGT